MATRLYTNRDYYMTWLTSTLTLKGGWDAGASSPTPLHFSPVKENAGTPYQMRASSPTAPGRRAFYYGISPRLSAQTISGTVNPMVFLCEQDAALNCFIRLHVYVTVGDTNAVRGTLLNQFEDTVNEFAVGYDYSMLVAQQFGAAQALTPVVAQAGDRIGIELGWVQHGVVASTSTISVVGTRYLNGDAVVGSTYKYGTQAAQTLNQFIEFSANLAFQPTTAANDACATAAPVSTFPYTATVDTWNSATVNQPNKVGNCSNWGDDSLPVWWKIVVPAGRILTIHTQGSAYPTIVSLWTGTCAALTHVKCADGPTSAAPLVFGNTSGADYYLLVNRDVYDAGDEVTGPGGLVSVSISAAVAQPHGCTLATTIPSIPYTVSGLDTTSLNTDLSPTPSCISNPTGHMQWFKYIPATSHRLYITAAGTNYDHVVAIYTGTCPNGPWTERACKYGSVATPSRISYQVTAGTTYWIVAAAYNNPGGLLNLFVGDSTALGFIRQGEAGAIEWEGNYFYHDCNGHPCFLQILQPVTGNKLIALRLFQVFTCTTGNTVRADVLRLEVLNGATVLPAPPYTTYTVPPECGPETYNGHYNAGQGQLTDPGIWASTYNGSFGMRFRLSSWDSVNDERLPDGYLEVRWPQSSFGTYRYDNLILGSGRIDYGAGQTTDPSTWEGIVFHPGWWTTRMYVRQLDEFCDYDPTASDLVWCRDFTETPATNAELFAEYGGLFNRVGTYCSSISAAGALPGAPRIDSAGRPTYIGIYQNPAGTALRVAPGARLYQDWMPETPAIGGSILLRISPDPNTTIALADFVAGSTARVGAHSMVGPPYYDYGTWNHGHDFCDWVHTQAEIPEDFDAYHSFVWFGLVDGYLHLEVYDGRNPLGIGHVREAKGSLTNLVLQSPTRVPTAPACCHVAFTTDWLPGGSPTVGGTYRLYVNGVLVASAQTNAAPDMQWFFGVDFPSLSIGTSKDGYRPQVGSCRVMQLRGSGTVYTAAQLLIDANDPCTVNLAGEIFTYLFNDGTINNTPSTPSRNLTLETAAATIDLTAPDCCADAPAYSSTTCSAALMRIAPFPVYVPPEGPCVADNFPIDPDALLPFCPTDPFPIDSDL